MDQSGHILVVRGYDSSKQEALYMDPGFHEDEQTYVTYPLTEFMKAWVRRSGLSYVIESD